MAPAISGNASAIDRGTPIRHVRQAGFTPVAPSNYATSITSPAAGTIA
jgi:hypothetical protein